MTVLYDSPDIVRIRVLRALATIEGVPAHKRPIQHARRGWMMPPAPICPRCKRYARPVALDTGEGWVLGWECEKCGPDDFNWDYENNKVGDHIFWPFAVNRAGPWDLEALGFTIV